LPKWQLNIENYKYPRLLGVIDTEGIFADRLLGVILGLPAIKLPTSFLLSFEADPGEFVIVRGIGAWSANETWQTSPPETVAALSSISIS
jgi:hypothetical protein